MPHRLVQPPTVLSMKLFINAINLSSAGGLNVTLNFLKELRNYQPDDMKVYVAAPRHCGYESLASERLQLIWLPERANYWVTRLYTDYVWIPALIRKCQADVVFTMGNFATPTSVCQALLLHYPHPAYPDDQEVWKRLGWLGTINVWVRNYMFSLRLIYVNVLLVQTETMRSRIRNLYPQLPAIELLPNAYTQLHSITGDQVFFDRKPRVRYLLCLSRYYSHKNIEVLVDVANLTRQQDLPFRILITIEAKQHHKARQLLKRIHREGLADVLMNIGTVPADRVASLYKQVDGLIMPTLLESLTSTYADAMHFGVPIFTSRRDFSEEICGDCVYYFDPLSAQSIVSTVQTAFSNPSQMREKLEKGRLRSSA